MGETPGEGPPQREPLADTEGGAGDEALEVGRELQGDIVGGVFTVRVRSGWDTELTQQRLDSLESLRIGRLGWNLVCSIIVGLFKEGIEVEVEESELENG